MLDAACAGISGANNGENVLTRADQKLSIIAAAAVLGVDWAKVFLVVAWARAVVNV
jgi:hypothetical protein